MVMYTVELSGEVVAERRITLVFETNEGGQRSEGKTDRTGVASMWGPWSASVRILVDSQTAVEHAEWQERPADRYTEAKSGD